MYFIISLHNKKIPAAVSPSFYCRYSQNHLKWGERSDVMRFLVQARCPFTFPSPPLLPPPPYAKHYARMRPVMYPLMNPLFGSLGARHFGTTQHRTRDVTKIWFFYCTGWGAQSWTKTFFFNI